MRFTTKALEVPTGAGTGTAINVERFVDRTVLVGGTFTATIRLQGTLDGTNYVDLTGDVSAPGVVQLPQTLKYLRVRTIAFTSAPAVSFAGMDSRAV